MNITATFNLERNEVKGLWGPRLIHVPFKLTVSKRCSNCQEIRGSDVRVVVGCVSNEGERECVWLGCEELLERTAWCLLLFLTHLQNKRKGSKSAPGEKKSRIEKAQGLLTQSRIEIYVHWLLTCLLIAMIPHDSHGKRFAFNGSSWSELFSSTGWTDAAAGCRSVWKQTNWTGDKLFLCGYRPHVQIGVRTSDHVTRICTQHELIFLATFSQRATDLYTAAFLRLLQ